MPPMLEYMAWAEEDDEHPQSTSTECRGATTIHNKASLTALQ